MKLKDLKGLEEKALPMIRRMDETYNKHEKLVADFKRTELRFGEQFDEVEAACARAIWLCAVIVVVGILTHIAVAVFYACAACTAQDSYSCKVTPSLPPQTS